MLKHFDYIIVIESLRAEDRRTGKELFDSIISGKSAQLGFQCLYRYVKNFQELKEVFDEIEYKVRKFDLVPLIHIEAHGSTDAIQLESSEIIDWGIIAALLGSLNFFTKNNLTLSVATCHAIHLSRAVNLVMFPPYYLLIAPDGDAYPDDIEQGYTEFYETYLEMGENQVLAPNFQKAMQKLNENRRTKFYFHLAEMRFEAAWQEFRERYDTEEKVNSFVNKLAKANRYPSAAVEEDMRAVLLATLDPKQEMRAKEHIRTSFLMLDSATRIMPKE